MGWNVNSNAAVTNRITEERSNSEILEIPNWEKRLEEINLKPPKAKGIRFSKTVK
jgi:hypothetical protein